MRLKAALVLVLLSFLSAGCTVSSSEQYPDFNAQYQDIVNPYSFNFAAWEFNTIKDDIKRQITAPLSVSDLDSAAVVSYFTDVSTLESRRNASRLAALKNGQTSIFTAENDYLDLEKRIEAQKPAVEQILAAQISQVLANQGIYNPLSSGWLKLTFPPVKFKLVRPLSVLVVSPRDRIERMEETVIQPDVTEAQIVGIESSLEELNISAIVVPIGGLGATYPSFVIDNADLRFTLNAAVEEWLHQYLAFTPLGFAYVLDLLNIVGNADIPILNETVAGVAAQELGGMVYDRYYAQLSGNTEPEGGTPPISGFDFNAAMREIRQNVDHYLALGKIEEAEKYMRERQQYLAANGYYLRKLNQAYFAFYGSYAYSPTSVDPIGRQVMTLRQNSASLKQFLDRVAVLKSRQDLETAANNSR